MAKNLRAKLPREDMLYIQDVNPSSTEKFMSTEPAGNVKVASNPREVAENAVRLPTLEYVSRCDEQLHPQNLI